MRRMLLWVVAATVCLPASAFATMEAGNADRLGAHSMRSIDPQRFSGNNATLGTGILDGTEPGHPTGPGKTRADTESRAPINDVTPGLGTDDTQQSKNPPPAR